MAPVSDGLVVDRPDAVWYHPEGHRSHLDQLISVDTLDPDETVNIEISGLPEGATLSYIGDDTDRAVFDEAAGTFSVTGLATAPPTVPVP